MSLRDRLILLVVVSVVLVALALSGLYLEGLVSSLSDDAIERAQLASQQVNSFLIDHINQQSEEYETPSNLDETKALWYQIVSSDNDVSTALVRMMAPFLSVVEINIAGESGQILASTNPDRIGMGLTRQRDFVEWSHGPMLQRVRDVISRQNYWELASQVGIKEQPHPVFTIQVVTSSVLLKPALVERVRPLIEVSGGSVLAAVLITLLSANLVLRPLKRIERTIDKIVQGDYHQSERPSEGILKLSRANEFAAVESKLDLLGQKFSGAREDARELRHNVDKLIERLATQLDVASRLAAISRLTGGVAHEIKNPLNAISLRLDLVRARLSKPDTDIAEAVMPELDILSREVLRLDRVVKTFLDFSRPMEVKFQEVDLAVLAKELTDVMTPQARANHVTLELEAPPEPARMRADPDLIRQAILNLVSNAIEAMKEGGSLRVTVRQAEGSISLEVADSGPGIPEDLRDKVFQLYFTTKTRGSGIGLALTYRAVQLHNGSIWFKSEEGMGTTFHLEFPVEAHA
jgi:signal transduction histidine kinase